MKKVNRAEFDDFIVNYPRPLERNFFMDWLEYYDFPENVEIHSIEELHSYCVAREYCGPWDDSEQYIREVSE